MKKNILYIFLGLVAFMNIAIAFFFVGWATAVEYTQDLRRKNIPLEMEKCDVRSTLSDLDSEFWDTKQKMESKGVPTDEFLDLWNIIEGKREYDSYLECLEEI